MSGENTSPLRDDDTSPLRDGNTSSLRAWAELLRLPALFTVPGDALAGAAAIGARPGRGTLLALGSSLCLYEAGMALNDWADRAEDAVDRPHRPIPSGRIRPAAALTAATALTAAGVGLAFRAGRTPGALAGALAATVWAYDLGLKRTPAGPAAMGAARALDVLLGAAATAGGGAGLRSGQAGTVRAGVTASPAAAVFARVAARAGGGGGSRPERPRQPRAALTALATMAGRVVGGVRGAVAPCGAAGARPEQPRPLRTAASVASTGATPAAVAARSGRAGATRSARPAGLGEAVAAVLSAPGSAAAAHGGRAVPAPVQALRAALPTALAMAAHTTAVTVVSRNETTGGKPLAPAAALAATATLTGRLLKPPAGRGGAAPLGLPGPLAYAVTAARPLFHAALNPSPPLTQRAVGAGIRAMIPLQAALAARAGAPGTALVTAALVPLARRFSRKVSVT